jgi:hypothetical protein
MPSYGFFAQWCNQGSTAYLPRRLGSGHAAIILHDVIQKSKPSRSIGIDHVAAGTISIDLPRGR